MEDLFAQHDVRVESWFFDQLKLDMCYIARIISDSSKCWQTPGHIRPTLPTCGWIRANLDLGSESPRRGRIRRIA